MSRPSRNDGPLRGGGGPYQSAPSEGSDESHAQFQQQQAYAAPRQAYHHGQPVTGSATSASPLHRPSPVPHPHAAAVSFSDDPRTKNPSYSNYSDPNFKHGQPAQGSYRGVGQGGGGPSRSYTGQGNDVPVDQLPYGRDVGVSNQTQAGGSGADFRRKKSLVRPERERQDPNDRLFHYRQHAAQLEDKSVVHPLYLHPSARTFTPLTDGPLPIPSPLPLSQRRRARGRHPVWSV